MEMEKVFNPQAIETDLYKEWEENGYFKAERDESKKPFTIVMPPPNVTGQLHMGHAMDNTLQDILIRFKRMQGYAALWVPGTDHASIATEAKVVAAMKEEGLTKEMLGRDGFLERAWAWKHKYGNRIVSQLKKLGSSCDWSRERFTMDEGCSDAVREVFKRLYDKGLIYRGNRMVNWCTCCNTSISDAEVEYEEKDGFFWHLYYTVKETGEKLELATTRPETMLGDTAVAINPEDPRYAHLHGCHVILPLLNKEIPIVCDEHADMEKGTGVVKITPAHDPNDFEVGRRHDLPMIRVLTYDGQMTGAADKAAVEELRASGRATADEPDVLDCGKYAGMTAQEARKAILKDLEACGALKEAETIHHDVGTCYRCHNVIEPMISKQWFVRMEPLAKPAIEAVEKDEIRYVPERFTKTYMNWMRNTRDWCISRQLWWGHQIPVWYCDDCGETNVAKEAPCKCAKCGSEHLTQDPDTLDTWFSSALWPFSTLGWPNEESEDLKFFYPTSVLVTGYDIISFWVSRMIFSGLSYTGKAPFSDILIHGIVRDAQGRKMSKSLGNGIDPLEIIDQYGADALRFSLLMGVSPGNDTRFSTEKVEAARNFANKVWNASRFVMMNLEGYEALEGKELADSDKWILTRFDDTVREVTQHLEEFDLGMAAQKVYDFIWSQFCDWYIELSKARLQGENKKTVQAVLIYVLTGMLKLLHPFMPFLTDAVYRFVPGTEGTIMLKQWPEARDDLRFDTEAAQMEGVMDIIRAVRNLRAEMNVAVGRRAHLMLRASEGWHDTLEKSEAYFGRLAWVSGLTMLAPDAPAPEKTVSAVAAAAELFIPLGDLVDIEKEVARLEKELKGLEGEISRAEGKLNNPGFVAKAPAALVEKEREKLEINRGMLEALKTRIASLKAL